MEPDRPERGTALTPDPWMTVGSVWRQPSFVLLATQLAGVLLYPFLDQSTLGRALFSLFTLLVLVLAIRAVRATPALDWVSILIGIPVAILTVLEAIAPTDPTIVLWSGVLHAAFYLFVSYAFLRYMFFDRVVTLDELFAVGAVFTVLAWAFAYLYSAVQVIWPGSFTAAISPEAPRTWFELLFLSFTTLTSTGLSDVLPVLPHARSVVMIEQLAGLMYVALVISRIVGLTLRPYRR
jgi:Ion channel